MPESPSQRRFRAFSQLFLTLPLLGLGSGCCSISAWACGVDRSAWVSIDFRTPDLALATVQEALRRGDGGRQGLFLALSEHFKGSLPGLSQNPEAFEIGYEELKEQQPSLFVLGSASVLDSKRLSPSLHRFVLDLDGEEFEMVFVRQSYAAYEFEKSNGKLGDYGEYQRMGGPGSAVRATLEESTLRERLSDLDPVAGERTDPETLVRLGVGQEWKLAEFAPLEEDEG